MDSDLVNEIIEVLLPVLATILTAVFSWIGMKLKSLYEEKVNTETKQKIAELTVKYIEQVCKDLNGPDKLQKALVTASDWLKDKGISINEAELLILIEAAVKSLNMEQLFNEEVACAKKLK